MRAHEPLVGRDDDLHTVSEAVTDTGTPVVVISGENGIGRTRLLREALRRLDSAGHPTITVSGTPGGSSVPFGAFARMLPEPSTERLSQAELVSEMVGLWSAPTGEGKRRVIAVDDAHLLDNQSTLLLSELAEHGESLVIVTFPDQAAIPEAVTSLWKDRAGAWVALEPLGFDETAEMLAGMLEGPVDGSLARAVADASTGSPLWIRELLLAAHSAGLLERETNGLWRLSGRLPLSPRLEQLIRMHLGHVSERAREAAQVLSLVEEALPLTRLRRLVDVDAVAEAERAGVLRLDDEWVALTHPLYGTLLREKVPALTARRIYSQLASAVLETGTLTDVDVLQVTRWQHAAGEESEGALLSRAALVARDRSDHEQAWWLARRAGVDEPDAGFDLLSVAGEACLWTRRLAQASRYFERAHAAAQEPTARARSMIGQAAALFMGAGLIERATELLERATELVRPAASEWHAALSLRGSITLAAGRVGETLELVEAGRHDETGRHPSSMLLSVQVSALTWSGRMADAADLAERTAPASHIGIAALDCLDRVVLATAKSYLGQRDTALDHVRHHYDKALLEGNTETRAMWAFAYGNAELVAGYVTSAVSWLLEATTLMRSCHTGLGPASHARCLAELAHALARTGNTDRAERTLAEAEKLPLSGCVVPALALARAHVSAVQGDTRTAATRLRAVIEETEAVGGFLWTAQSLFHLVLLTRSARAADRLARLAPLLQGPLVAAWSRFARAFVDDDGHGLVDVASEYVRFGHAPVAAWIFDIAAELLHAQGQPKQALLATHARDRLELPEHDEAVAQPDARPSARLTPLTPRERVIVDLVASGRTAADAARTLGLSRRTVESHLQHAYDKLGVHSRTELIELVHALGQ